VTKSDLTAPPAPKSGRGEPFLLPGNNSVKEGKKEMKRVLTGESVGGILTERLQERMRGAGAADLFQAEFTRKTA
jgi:hypothetical protein